MVKPVLTQAYVRSRLEYHEDGTFTWRRSPLMPNNWNSRCAGKRAGSFNKHSRGEWLIGIDTINYGFHRVVFLYHHGYMPDEVDHIDLNRSNNRIENLREANRNQNNFNKTKQSNNTSGHKGVRWRKDRAHWVAGITANGVSHYLGSFATKELAIEAYEKAAKELHGEFARLE
jgi:hypothetical protein